MGYRYKHGGYAERLYTASVMVNGHLRSVRYRCVWAKNSWGHFYDLRRRVQQTFGVEIKRKDVLSVELLADSLWCAE